MVKNCNTNNLHYSKYQVKPTFLQISFQNFKYVKKKSSENVIMKKTAKIYPKNNNVHI